MLPRSFSATSLQIASGCLARFKYSVMDRAAEEQGDAAGVGLVLHGTLEEFIRGVFIRKDMPWNEATFLAQFNGQYQKFFGPDNSLPEYADALGIARKWYFDQENYDHLSKTKILSLESKNSFPIPVLLERGTPNEQAVSIPVNYIMDRTEQLGPNVYKVVDYKTNRVPLTHEQLANKIQARLYALAMQIIYKNAETVWVEFDFLRHERIGIAFSKADNAETWRMLKRAVQRVVDTSEEEAIKLETINSECVFCVRRATCGTLASNVRAGGIYSHDAESAGRRFVEVKAQLKALKTLEQELQDFLLKELIAAETTDLHMGNVRIKLKRSSEREMDTQAIAKAIGPELTSELGKFTLAGIDNLVKSGRLTSEQLKAVEAAITRRFGMPRPDVTILE